MRNNKRRISDFKPNKVPLSCWDTFWMVACLALVSAWMAWVITAIE